MILKHNMSVNNPNQNKGSFLGGDKLVMTSHLRPSISLVLKSNKNITSKFQIYPGYKLYLKGFMPDFSWKSAGRVNAHLTWLIIA